MANWLFKSEPGVLPWETYVAAGTKGRPAKKTRNALANKNFKAMKTGDLGFFYHTGKEKRIVGIVTVVREYYPDAEDQSGRFGLVDTAVVEALPRPVTLAAIKAEPRLEEMVLVKNSRLAVQPVEDDQWALVRAMGGLDE